MSADAIRIASLGLGFWLAWPQVQERIEGAQEAAPDKARTDATADEAFIEHWRRAPRAWQLAIERNIRPELHNRAAALAGCESNFSTTARCNSCLGVREDSWGGWQHNRLVWGHLWDVFDMNTLDGQAQAFQHVFDIQGFPAWRNCAERLGII